MEQRFQLKHYGQLSLFEQEEMPADERAWFLKRLEKELKDRQEQEKKQMGSIPKPRMPSVRR